MMSNVSIGEDLTMLTKVYEIETKLRQLINLTSIHELIIKSTPRAEEIARWIANDGRWFIHRP